VGVGLQHILQSGNDVRLTRAALDNDKQSRCLRNIKKQKKEATDINNCKDD